MDICLSKLYTADRALTIPVSCGVLDTLLAKYVRAGL